MYLYDLPKIGFLHNWATVRATTATLASGAPIPGPCNTGGSLHAVFYSDKSTSLSRTLHFTGTVILCCQAEPLAVRNAQ